jgi:hypothetical protein
MDAKRTQLVMRYALRSRAMITGKYQNSAPRIFFEAVCLYIDLVETEIRRGSANWQRRRSILVGNPSTRPAGE